VATNSTSDAKTHEAEESPGKTSIDEQGKTLLPKLPLLVGLSKDTASVSPLRAITALVSSGGAGTKVLLCTVIVSHASA
jgi:hypothetical protein